jgi:hypothetical protein
MPQVPGEAVSTIFTMHNIMLYTLRNIQVSERVDHILYHHIMPLVPGAVDHKATDKEKEKKDKEKKLALKKRSKVEVAKEAGSIYESTGFKRKETKHTGGGGGQGVQREGRKVSGEESSKQALRNRASKSPSRISSPLKTLQQQRATRAEALKINHLALQNLFVALARDGARGLVLRDVCALLLACGVIRSTPVGGEAHGVEEEAKEDSNDVLDLDAWSFSSVVCMLLAVDLNMKPSDNYILENAANIDVTLSFIAFADGLLTIAENLPATHAIGDDALTEQLGSLLARLLAVIDRRRQQEERKRELLLAELLANSNRHDTPPHATDTPDDEGGAWEEGGEGGEEEEEEEEA